MAGCVEENPRTEDSELPPIMVVCPGTGDPPYNYVNPSGDLDGMEIALLKVTAGCLGRKLEFREASFSELLRILEAEEADLAVDCIAVNEERKQRVLFSQPYMVGKQAIVTHPNAKLHTNKHSPEELRGRRVATVRGTVSEQIAIELDVDIQRYACLREVLDAVSSEHADAGIIHLRPAELFLRGWPNLYICPNKLREESYAFAFSRKAKRLRDQTDSVLEAMRRTGHFQRITAHYEAEFRSRGTVTPTNLQPVIAELKNDSVLKARLRELAAE